MPPSSIKTIKDLLHYQYAKLIAKSANKNNDYKFIMSKKKQLDLGEINMSGFDREFRHIDKSRCVYCPSTDNLSLDHIISRKKGGINSRDNSVDACRSCNSSKGSKGLYEWYGLSNKDKLPRIVEGTYLKFLYKIHKSNGTLDATDLNGDGKLNVLDLEVF